MTLRHGICTGLLVAGLAGTALAQMSPYPTSAAPRVVYIADPGTPEVVVLKPSFPARGRVCAEPPTGLVSCRTAAEFRAWVAHQPAVK